MMGVCFECLVEIDGVANCQACMTEVRDGMAIKRQSGANNIGIAVAGDHGLESQS
jgi:predicted molibdopterin-dependent oxidoreductase YjgC